MSKWQQGKFKPKNPEKCLNKDSLTYRSSWELIVMSKCDLHPCVLKWGSEIIKIPYINPLTNTQKMYIPDFFIQYIDVKKNIRNMLIEVKPIKETLEESAKTKYDKLCLLINRSKWASASKFCQLSGIEFKILSENDLFGGLLR